MVFDKTRWSCPCNSDQSRTQNFAKGEAGRGGGRGGSRGGEGKGSRWGLGRLGSRG